MRKKCALVLCFLMLLSCVSTLAEAPEIGTPYCVVTLEENPSTGYVWDYRFSDSSIVQISGDEFTPGDSEPVGAPGTHAFRFEALADGEALISIGLVPPDGSMPDTINTYSAAVEDGVFTRFEQKTYHMIVLKSNPTTGFCWSASVADESVAAFAGSIYIQDDAPEDMVGVGGIEILYFEGIAPGETEISLEYARPWETEAPAETQTVKVIINDDLTMTEAE